MPSALLWASSAEILFWILQIRQGCGPAGFAFSRVGAQRGAASIPSKRHSFAAAECFKKQGSAPVFGFIFRFVKRVQLFICFFETFSAFSLLSNLQECFIIIKRSAAISRPVCKNGNPGSSQSVLAARPLCGGPGGLVFFKFYRVIGKRSILLC